MLRNCHAYAKLPASDAERARHFYVEVLGLQPGWEARGHMWFDMADGSSLLVFPSSGKASGDHDQCGWVVDDIDAEVADLRGRGITFEEFPGNTYIDGITADGYWRTAWFRDSEGNLLNVRSKTPRGG
jgi:catechol 2,3-dioxygenase-like lactoylglutathione lyase family enzyme